MIRLRKARHAVLQNRTFTRGYWCLEISLLGLCALMSFGVKHKECYNSTHLAGIWLTRNSGFRRSIFPRHDDLKSAHARRKETGGVLETHHFCLFFDTFSGRVRGWCPGSGRGFFEDSMRCASGARGCERRGKHCGTAHSVYFHHANTCGVFVGFYDTEGWFLVRPGAL